MIIELEFFTNLGVWTVLMLPAHGAVFMKRTDWHTDGIAGPPHVARRVWRGHGGGPGEEEGDGIPSKGAIGGRIIGTLLHPTGKSERASMPGGVHWIRRGVLRISVNVHTQETQWLRLLHV